MQHKVWGWKTLGKRWRNKMYNTCKWCGGIGCLACPPKKKQTEPELPQPIFTAKFDDPEDMEALKRTFGREALEKALSPDGGGMREITENAAMESLFQALRKNLTDESKTL